MNTLQAINDDQLTQVAEQDLYIFISLNSANSGGFRVVFTVAYMQR